MQPSVFTAPAAFRRFPDHARNPTIANPINTRANTLSRLMPEVPDMTTFFKWNDTLQQWEDPCTFITGLGWLSDTSLLPGEGGLIQNYSGEPFTVTFIGEVLQGNLIKPVPVGLSIRSSMVPQAGGITTLLGFGPEDGLASGDKLDRYDNLWDSYVIYTYNGSVWYRTTPPPSTLLEPAPAVGESFWFETLGPRTWQRTFSVWP